MNEFIQQLNFIPCVFVVMAVLVSITATTIFLFHLVGYILSFCLDLLNDFNDRITKKINLLKGYKQ